VSAVTVREARSALLAAVAPQPTLRLPLRDAAGHVLAEEIVARWPLPSWTAASMDGFAVRADDVRGASQHAPRRLPLSGGAPAGGPPPPPLAPGTAWRVATGGRVPEGADSVVRQEDTRPDHDAISVTDDRDAGRNVRPRGGDVAEGDAVFAPGVSIGPGQVALLAALGVAAPLVVRSPRVAVITSGDEVVALDHAEAVALGTHLADANTPMLEALVSAAGGVPDPIGLLPDDRATIATAVRNCGADLIVSAGAVSVGEHDHVPGAMADVGAELLFRRVLLRPGGPTTAARLPDGRIWLALPGNPVSAMVTFHLFGRPLIRALLGDPTPVAATESVTLADPTARHPRLELYLRAALSGGGGQLPVARLTGPQGSWVTSSIARADGVVRVPPGDGSTNSGALEFLRF
jgi:molybdopterin molybdotransferase